MKQPTPTGDDYRIQETKRRPASRSSHVHGATATTGSLIAALLLGVTGAGPCQAAHASIDFEEVAEAAGIVYAGPTWGASWRDFDRDGNVDVAISYHFAAEQEARTPLGLFRNLGNGRFADAGTALPKGLGRDMHGGAWADFDNDGDADLLLSAGGASGEVKTGRVSSPVVKNLLLVQEGGSFRDAAEEFGLAAPTQRGRRPSWIDVDLDSRLDVVFAQATPDDPDNILYRQTTTRFEPCATPFPGLGAKDSSALAIGFRGFSDDARYLAFQGDAAPGKLYRARGAGECGFDLVSDIKARNGGRDLVLADLTGDLGLDYFAPTRGYRAFERQGSSHTLAFGLPDRQPLTELAFRTAGPVAFTVRPVIGPSGWTKRERSEIFLGRDGKHPQSYQFTLDPADPLLHGARDLAAAAEGCFIHYDPENGNWKIRVKKNRWRTITVNVSSESPIERTSPDITADDEKWLKPDILLVQGERGWVEPERDQGPGSLKTSCATAVAGDFDNDMDLDLFLGCADDRGTRPNVLLENRGGRFVFAAPPGATEQVAGILESVTTADIDNDGFLDLMITHGGGAGEEAHGPVRLYRNLGGTNNWLKIDLAGTRNARDAFGARVFASAGGRTQVRQHTGGGHASGQNEPVLHFGLGRNPAVDEILVEWPDGTLEYFGDVPVNARVTLTEGQGEPATQPVIMSAADEVSPGAEVHFLGLAPRALVPASIHWDFGDAPASPGGKSVRHRFERAGTARVKMTATTVDGEQIEAIRSIAVR